MRSNTIHDPVLGTLVHEDDYYEGTVEFEGNSVDFSLGTYKVANVDECLERGRSVVQSLSAVIRRAKAHAANRLLALKNDTWEEEDGRMIDQSEFESRITIASITVEHHGMLVLYFDDGGLFFGHDILVTESAEGVLSRAEIQG